MIYDLSIQHMKRLRKFLFYFLVIALATTSYYYYEFVYRGAVEPPASAQSTNTDPLLTMKNFRSGMKQYGQLYQATMSGPRMEKDYGTYVIPGLKSTRSLSSGQPGEISVCTSMTPQGIAVSHEYVFISAYCHTKTHNSVIYVLDREMHYFLKEIVLPGKPHVGSLAYDEENDNLWICGSGKGLAQANALSIDDIQNYSLTEMVRPIEYKFQNHVLEMQRSSFMTYMDNHIYIGFFHSSKNGVLRKYRLEEDGNLYRSTLRFRGTRMESGIAIESASVPKQSQGIAFYYDKLFLSQSLGILPSRLVIFDESLEHQNYYSDAAMMSLRLPSMLEQIYIYEDELYMLFESAAFAYRDLPTFSMDRVLKVNVSELKRLVNEELQVRRAQKVKELTMKREANKTIHWNELKELPWIAPRIQLLTPQLVHSQSSVDRFLNKIDRPANEDIKQGESL